MELDEDEIAFIRTAIWKYHNELMRTGYDLFTGTRKEEFGRLYQEQLAMSDSMLAKFKG